MVGVVQGRLDCDTLVQPTLGLVDVWGRYPPEDSVRCALYAFRAVIIMQHLRRWTQKQEHFTEHTTVPDWSPQ
jgi:hypothetical protein